jgi:hypothetical protein
MYRHSLNCFTIACVIALATTIAKSSHAEYRKVGPDMRSEAQVAEDQCASQSAGSKEVIAGSFIAGVIGMAVARDMFIKDCMRSRGFEWQSRKKPRASVKAN